MTSLLTSKRKFKFQVTVRICDLNDLPLITGSYFAKLRLLSGGKFTAITEMAKLNEHQVTWSQAFHFTCQIPSNSNGVLESCELRISLRKVVKGGKSNEKLGFVDVNLSEFAGSGVSGETANYLLEGYHQKRSDNSNLRINISMLLQSADPLFKVPQRRRGHMRGPSATYNNEYNPEDRKAPQADHNPDITGLTLSCATSSLSTPTTPARPNNNNDEKINIRTPGLSQSANNSLERHSSSDSKRNSSQNIVHFKQPSMPVRSRVNDKLKPETLGINSIEHQRRHSSQDPRSKINLASSPVVTPRNNSHKLLNESRVDADELVANLLREESQDGPCQIMFNEDEDSNDVQQGTSLALFIDSQGRTMVDSANLQTNKNLRKVVVNEEADEKKMPKR